MSDDLTIPPPHPIQGAFVLRVADNRFESDGIRRGDLVIVAPGAPVNEGDWVVGSPGNVALVYRYTEGITPAVIGKIIGLMRNYE